MIRPFSESCEQNKQVIYETIKPYLQGRVLEIASGTGQHALHFSELCEQLCWQTSDLEQNLPGIKAWLAGGEPQRLPPPILLDVEGDWPDQKYNLVFTANSFHIMSQAAVVAFFAGVSKCLETGGHLIVYGPFNYAGDYTSASNERFDYWLKHRDSQSGIRDFEWLQELAADAGLELQDDVAMPHNNRTLIWIKRT